MLVSVLQIEDYNSIVIQIDTEFPAPLILLNKELLGFFVSDSNKNARMPTHFLHNNCIDIDLGANEPFAIIKNDNVVNIFINSIFLMQHFCLFIGSLARKKTL